MNQAALDVAVDAVLVGRPAPLPGGRAPSAIVKSPALGPITVGPLGLDGDAQADRRHHGGPEKALHHYPREHYAEWVAWMPEEAGASGAFERPGAFGENLSTVGLTEADVCVGDVFALGTARVQVSQGRQPCWKLDLRHGRTGVARRMQELRRTGWYYRVLSPGVVAAGDRLVLVDRPAPGWPLARVLAALFDRSTGPDEWGAAASLEVLAAGWRETFARRVGSGRVEDWSARLRG